VRGQGGEFLLPWWPASVKDDDEKDEDEKGEVKPEEALYLARPAQNNAVMLGLGMMMMTMAQGAKRRLSVCCRRMCRR